MQEPHNSGREVKGTMARGIPVLMYHHISPVPGPYTVSPENFRMQLRWLKQSGYRCLTAEEFRAYQQGELSDFGKAVMLTFDDGWIDNWLHAAPALKAYGFSATLFVVTGWPGSGPIRTPEECLQFGMHTHGESMELVQQSGARDSVIMRWSELQQLEESGLFDIECHSHSHGGWWHRGDQKAINIAFSQDVTQAIQCFSENMGRQPGQYCWPRGQFTKTMLDVVRASGIAIQYSTLRGSNVAGQSGQLARRINVEDQPLSWFRRRVQFYSSPWLSKIPALLHQHLHARRLRQHYGEKLDRSEFDVPGLRLL